MEMVYIVVAIFTFKLIDTLNILPHQLKNVEREIIDKSKDREIMEYVSYPEYSFHRKSIDLSKLEKVKEFYKLLGNDVRTERKYALRRSEHSTKRDANFNLRDEHASLAEKELKKAHKKSALYDRPYVESNGGRDFLVLRPDMLDPFVTVIPNDIYYATEKKCVNWLDDCSLQGIRARLLRGVQWPFK